MVDTKRTSTDLVTNLFQDGQAANAITENHFRDHVVSMVCPTGRTSIKANAVVTVVGTAGVFVPLAGTWVVSGIGNDVTEATDGAKLTYTGTPDRHFDLYSSIDMKAVGNQKILSFSWRKNGTTLLPEQQDCFLGTGSDVSSMTVLSDVILSTGDFVELVATNLTDTTNLLAINVYVRMTGRFI